MTVKELMQMKFNEFSTLTDEQLDEAIDLMQVTIHNYDLRGFDTEEEHKVLGHLLYTRRVRWEKNK